MTTTIKRVTRVVAATSAALLATTTLAGTGTAASVAGDGTGGGVGVFVQRNHVVLMPTELQPGVHKLVVRSARSASLQLVKRENGYAPRQAVKDMQVMFEDMRALRRFERNTTLAGGVSSEPEAPGVLWVNLQRGTYWAIDTNDRTPTVAEITTVHVSGAAIPGDFPRVTGVVRAVDGLEFRAPRQVPQRGRLAFQNLDDQVHMLGFSKLARGKTIADFRAWVEGGASGRPPVNFEVGANAGVIDPQQDAVFRYELPRGRYVMYCFWPDPSMGGMPHVMMGMYRGIRVG